MKIASLFTRTLTIAAVLASAIALRGQVATPTFRAGTTLVEFTIVADDLYFSERNGQVIADIDIGLVEQTSKGPTNVRQQPMVITLQDPARDQRSQLIPVKTTWPLNAATSAVRVIVRDRLTGRYGTLEMALDRR